MTTKRTCMILNSVLLLMASLHARDGAVLRNGFTISHDHRQQLGAVTRLFLSTSDDEYVDVATEKIVDFEKEVALVETQHAASLASQPPAFAGPPSLDLNQIVEEAARRNQLDSDFVHALIRAESNGNVNAVSRKGAQGLMQLMPGTAARLGVKNSFDANENVNAGAKYLRELLARYKNDPVRALAAYNAGAGRVQQYNGVPPYRETRAYISAVIRDFNRRKSGNDAACCVSPKSSKKAAGRVAQASATNAPAPRNGN